MKGKYTIEYYKKRGIIQESQTKEGIEEEINKNIGRAEEIVKQFGKEGKLLDIGCGAGFFIACLKRYGWDVRGIDISEWATNFAREKLDLHVLMGSIEDVEISDQFDVITMYHILEHLSHPLQSLKKVSEKLSNDGVLVVKGPNLASFDRIWHGTNWRGYTVQYHFYYFTQKTYQMLLERAGFSIQKIVFQYWDPISRLKEIKLGDGIRADHPSDVFEKFYRSKEYNNLIFKGIYKIGYVIARLLNLKGRDLTIYAKKRSNL